MYNTEIIEESIQKMTIENGSEILGIIAEDNTAYATSRHVAKIFGKKHKHILEKVRKYRKMDREWTESNFRPSKYKDASGKKNKMYLMTFKGFSMLVMGFTGEKAFRFKQLYIEAFEAMQEFITNRIISKGEYKEMTSAICKYIDPDDGRYYAKEADMINQAVLGMKASEFKELHNLKDYKPTRDSVAGQKIEELNEAQRMNTRLIEAGYDFETRKAIINKSFRS